MLKNLQRVQFTFTSSAYRSRPLYPRPAIYPVAGDSVWRPKIKVNPNKKLPKDYVSIADKELIELKKDEWQRRKEAITSQARKEKEDGYINIYQDDPYYNSPATNSDLSDYERLIGQKNDRREDGERIFSSPQSIVYRETAKLLRRNYFRNKRKHLIKDDPPPVEQAFESVYEPDPVEQSILYEALSLGENAASRFALNFKTVYTQSEQAEPQSTQISEIQRPHFEFYFQHYLSQDIKTFHESRNQLQSISEKDEMLETLINSRLPEKDDDITDEDEEYDLAQGDDQQDVFKQYLEASDPAYYGVGRRKSCKTAVKITKGTGIVLINKKPIHDYFLIPYYRALTMVPMQFTGLACYLDVEFNVRGSGSNGQSEAMLQALARALVSMCPILKKAFRKLRFTRTDRRKVECKRAGLLKARKSPPYNRR